MTLASLAALLVPSAAHGGRSPAGGREGAIVRAMHTATSAGALIPAWTRKYNMNCSGCHYPAAPRLNATGIKFRWAGYRMPEELGDKVDVTQLSNYIALRGRVRYEYSKTENQSAASGFRFNDATFFYAGPFGQNYAGFFELEREPSGEVEVVANVLGIWGTEKSYGGFRTGQMHWLLRDGVAGFDRPTGVRTPTPLSGAVTGGGVPFNFSADQLGVEWFFVTGRNRLSAELLNGVSRTGSGAPPDPDAEKDFAVIDQFLFDNVGSGLTAVGYYGAVKGLDTTASRTLRSHFSRFAVSANKIYRGFEILGGFVWGKDQDLPGATTEVTGTGYWAQGQYMFPKPSLAVFARYEFVDPNTDVADNGKTRYVLGGVLPIGLPEYLRLAVEGALDVPQQAPAPAPKKPKTTGLTAELMLNF